MGYSGNQPKRYPRDDLSSAIKIARDTTSCLILSFLMLFGFIVGSVRGFRPLLATVAEIWKDWIAMNGQKPSRIKLSASSPAG